MGIVSDAFLALITFLRSSHAISCLTIIVNLFLNAFFCYCLLVEANILHSRRIWPDVVSHCKIIECSGKLVGNVWENAIDEYWTICAMLSMPSSFVLLLPLHCCCLTIEVSLSLLQFGNVFGIKSPRTSF